MGLFTSAEEKERKKQEAAKAKRDEFIEKYHLEEYADDIPEHELNRIIETFKGNAAITVGSVLSNDYSPVLLDINSMQEAIFNQNWIIIKLLANINRNLEDKA